MLPVIVKVAGDAALNVKGVAVDPVMFPVIAKPEALTVNPPPAAADVPPPTNDAVMAAFVMSATFTLVSIVTVKLLE
jgi:hypothetical protein